jgi:acetoacetate decarboxylase
MKLYTFSGSAWNKDDTSEYCLINTLFLWVLLLSFLANTLTAQNVPNENAPSKPAQNNLVTDGFIMMPAHFGINPVGYNISTDCLYGDVTTVTVSYLTDEALLKKYLPPNYELKGNPLVMVSYSMNREIDWLAGASYNIIGVWVPALYKGKVDRVTGDFALVLWENQTEPILAGRESRGIPKIFGEIEDHQIGNGLWRTSLSNRGHKILDLEAANLKPLSTDQLRKMEEVTRNSPMLGWKYIPNENYTGSVINYATMFPYSVSLREGWSATGNLEWHQQTWLQNPTQVHIVNALKSLPIKEIVSCVITKGSLTLHGAKARKLE